MGARWWLWEAPSRPCDIHRKKDTRGISGARRSDRRGLIIREDMWAVGWWQVVMRVGLQKGYGDGNPLGEEDK